MRASGPADGETPLSEVVAVDWDGAPRAAELQAMVGWTAMQGLPADAARAVVLVLYPGTKVQLESRLNQPQQQQQQQHLRFGGASPGSTGSTGRPLATFVVDEESCVAESREAIDRRR